MKEEKTPNAKGAKNRAKNMRDRDFDVSQDGEKMSYSEGRGGRGMVGGRDPVKLVKSESLMMIIFLLNFPYVVHL